MMGGPLRGNRGPRGMMPVVKPKNFKGTMTRLWKYFGGERKLLTVILIFIIVDSGIDFAVPYIIGRSIDTMSVRNGAVNFGILGIMAITLVVAYFADGAITFFQGWLMAGVSQRIVMNLSSALSQSFRNCQYHSSILILMEI